MSNDVQNHRLDVIERRLDKHDVMLAKLTESQIRTDEQYTALAKVQNETQEMIAGITKQLVKWMMAIGSAMLTVVLGGQVMM